MKSDLIKENNNDDNITDTSQIYQLKFNNDSVIGFKYSRYRDSNATETQRKNVKLNKESTKIKKNNEKCCAGKFCKQTRLMIWKNYLVFTRNLKPTVFQIFTPVVICIILVILQILVDNFNTSFINKNPMPTKLSNIFKCLYPNDCVTIGYGIIVNLFSYMLR